MLRRLYRRLKDVIVHRILGVDDTPHRIAWGVFLGFLVAWTPTLGFQIMLYVAVASLVRANKVSGIPILFISNPLTAVPFYWFAWWMGSLVLNLGPPVSGESEEMIRDRLAQAEGDGGGDWTSDIFTSEFWYDLGQTALDMGGELWMGALVLGLLTGAPGYFATLWAVKAYRRVKGRA